MDQARLGRYEIIAQLATGGMGRVSLGKSKGEGGFERHVVLKSLDAVDVDDAEATKMFLDEARILGMLHHQHLAAIQEVGRDSQGKLFIVLEYVHGHSAHELWERALDLEIHLPLDCTLTVISAAASGLHYAHTKRAPDGQRLSIVHRDVTPANIMLGFDGTVKVIDFGIAKAALRATKTQSGFIKGKIGYMAPEQLRGQALDARTDVFALGIVLYELTTMVRAFREKSDRATVENIKAGRYKRPSEIVADYPPALEAIVAKALNVDAAKRYQSADEMRMAVEQLGQELHLVVGDAAIVDTMMRMFPNHAEPWQRRASTRAETETAIEVEWEDPHIGITREAPAGALQQLLSRTNPPVERAISDLAIPEAHDEFGGESQANTRLSTNPIPVVDDLNVPPPPPPPEPARVLKPRGQHQDAVETTGEMLSPPTFAEPETRVDSDDVDLGDVISSLELDRTTGQAAVVTAPEPLAAAEPAPVPKARASKPEPEPKTEPRAVPKPAAAEPKAALSRVPPNWKPPKSQKTAYMRAQKPRSRIWLFAGTLIVAVAVAAAILMYLYERKKQAHKAPAAVPQEPVEPKPVPRDPKTAPMPSFPATIDAGTGSGSAEPAVAPGPTTLKVRITSTPSDATVVIDGARLGHTPIETEKLLEPGEHVIKIRLRGYSPQKRTIQVTDKEVVEDFALIRGN